MIAAVLQKRDGLGNHVVIIHNIGVAGRHREEGRHLRPAGTIHGNLAVILRHRDQLEMRGFPLSLPVMAPTVAAIGPSVMGRIRNATIRRGRVILPHSAKELPVWSANP